MLLHPTHCTRCSPVPACAHTAPLLFWLGPQYFQQLREEGGGDVVLFSFAAGGANWPITIRCPSLGPIPHAGGGGGRRPQNKGSIDQTPLKGLAMAREVHPGPKIEKK